MAGLNVAEEDQDREAPSSLAAVSPARSRNMAAVRGTDTRPEMLVRRALHRAGLRYRLHRRDLPGRPDLAFSAARVAVEIRGCFWHQHCGCTRATLPRTRADWWAAKLARNVERDSRNEAELIARGWNLQVVWECELAQDTAEVVGRLVNTIRQARAGRALKRCSCNPRGLEPT